MGCHGSFWLLYEQHSIYKSRQWVICFLDPVGNYNIGDVIICDFHLPFVIWCMHFVDICTSTNSMIVHHVVNINMMYINSVMLSLTILIYIIYLYSSKEHLQRCVWAMKTDFFIGHKIVGCLRISKVDTLSFTTLKALSKFTLWVTKFIYHILWLQARVTI